MLAATARFQLNPNEVYAARALLLEMLQNCSKEFGGKPRVQNLNLYLSRVFSECA